ncbi:MAG: protein-L-isoaspartate(D-aspartate) O-methyltransferase [Bacteroidetes bacterium]|jgi:protein-L-isoaspartate(D-aspartate) O-methyltransferase|nr:protein-L-isoaspartate(D-aspartate) O-methyltransferase [Bacteroidota bacterium]MBU1579236.1 protein-L-isoaspartate(D-aspartate) O-methyltransferase [Bacteroidota bacterium]MBU2559196.1 protein-L-isoaspartate(D-aspartate) O-methyltransferase [Bacteroidota bacterium]MDA3944471.1 protein-L-isoaspartate(D-aspartate) O-methyltransferase [Bacteroidota bacterium]
MQDTYRHKGLRKQLIETLRQKNISDERVLHAMEKIPRHFFLDSSFLEFAYQDKPFPIGSGQTISQPYTVAFQTELLRVSKGLKVLEIGTGSAYQACVLAEMGAKVFSIERQRKLYLKTKTFVEQSMPYKLNLYLADGNEGLPGYAPFDRILITAAAPEIPEALIDQLKVGGIMVIPLGFGDTQSMLRLIKTADGKLEREAHGAFRFVPLLDKIGND